jgi:hypothetical protein
MSRALAAWDRFWFEPTSTSPVGIWRICFGLMAVGWTISLAPDLFTFFSDDGFMQEQPVGQAWSVLGWLPGDATLVLLYVLTLAGALLVTVGCFSRLASILVFVGVVSFTRRDPYVFNAGDNLLRAMAFYVMLTPSGAALSVDRWRRARERFWDSPKHAPWALRLMQIQLSVVYLSGVWGKLQGPLWNDGTAVYYALELEDIDRLPLPSVLGHSLLLINLQTYGTIAVEAAIGILVWNRVARVYVLAIGALLHLTIDYAILVGFFSFAMLAAYTTFIFPEWLDGRLVMLRSRLRRSPLQLRTAGRHRD